MSNMETTHGTTIVCFLEASICYGYKAENEDGSHFKIATCADVAKVALKMYEIKSFFLYDMAVSVYLM